MSSHKGNLRRLSVDNDFLADAVEAMGQLAFTQIMLNKYFKTAYITLDYYSVSLCRYTLIDTQMKKLINILLAITFGAFASCEKKSDDSKTPELGVLGLGVSKYL